jgi:hypothetical protein
MIGLGASAGGEAGWGSAAVLREGDLFVRVAPSVVSHLRSLYLQCIMIGMLTVACLDLSKAFRSIADAVVTFAGDGSRQ